MAEPAPRIPPTRKPARHAAWVFPALAILAAALALYLIRAEKPWEGKLAHRIQEGRGSRIEQAIQVGLYGAAAFDLLCAGALMGTIRWWNRQLPEDFEALGHQPPLPRWFIPLLLVACCAGAGLRYPLATKSLWGDEIWNLQNTVMGERMPSSDPPGNLEFKQAGWDRTFFYYGKPTNSNSFGVASRLSLSLWRALTGHKPWEFEEFIFRLPNFLASLAAIFCLGFLLALWRHPTAGVAAAFLLALHPWHIRYGIDGGSYSGLFLLSILACIALTRAIKTGAWVWWLASSLLLAFALWSFPASWYLVATLGAATLLAIPARHGWGTAASGALTIRFVASGAFAALFLAPLLGPLIPQILAWTDVKGNNLIHGVFLRELWAAFSTGIPWQIPSEPGATPLVSIEKLSVAFPPWLWVVSLLIPGLCCLGFWRVLPRDRVTKLLLLGLVTAAPLAVIVAWKQHHYFYARYVIYGLAATLILLVLGIEQLSDLIIRVCPKLSRPRCSTLLHAIWIGVFALLTWPQTRVLLAYPYAPQRDVAQYLASLSKGDPDSIIAAGLNLGGDTPSVYYPWITRFEKSEELAALAARAKAENKPFYLFYGYNSFNRVDCPEPFRWIDSANYFEPVRTFQGIETQFHYVVLRYTGLPIQLPEKKEIP